MYPSRRDRDRARIAVDYLTYGLTLLSLVRVIFACALIVLFVTDLQHKILPNIITLPGIVIGFVCSFFLPPGWVSSLIGALVGGGSLWRSPKPTTGFEGRKGWVWVTSSSSQ